MRTVRGVGDASRALRRVDVLYAEYGGRVGCIAALKQHAVCLGRTAGQGRIGRLWGISGEAVLAAKVRSRVLVCRRPKMEGV